MYEFVLTASTLLCLAMALLLARHPAASLLHPASLYLLFHSFVFVIRPWFAYVLDYSFVYRLFQFTPSQADRITVILGANLAMVVFVAVSLAIARAPCVVADHEHEDAARRALWGPLLVAVGVLTPPAVASMIANWQLRSSGFEDMLRQDGAAVNVTGVGWFTDLSLAMGPCALLLLWLARFRWWGWAYFAVFALLQAGTGTRGPLIGAALGAALLYLLHNRRRWLDPRVVAVGVGALLAFNLVLPDRGAAVRGNLGSETAASALPSSAPEMAPLEGMDFANLEYFEYLVYAVPQRTGTWDYFAHTLQIFTEPIPRRLWPGKPIGSPVQMFSLWDYGTPTGMTASVPGIGWVSLGYPGIVIQAALFALIFALAYRRAMTGRGGIFAMLAYVILASSTLLVFRNGDLLSLIRLLPFLYAPLILTWLAWRMTVRGRAPRGGRAAATTSPAERRRALAAQAVQSRGG